MGINSDSYHEGSGTLKQVYGARVASGKRVDSSGTVEEAYGIRASVFNLSNPVSGEIIDGYGVYVGDVQARNAWCFYAASANPNYFAGPIQTASGSAAAPAYSFIGDSTGTFSPAANTWAVSTGGTERLRVTDTGDLLAATGYTPANDQSLATKKYVDDNSATNIVVLTQAEYDALGTKNPSTLYCISG